MKCYTFIVVLCLLFWNCEKVKDGDTIGPCVHTYEDPVIHIDSVTNAQNGSLISTFQILEIIKDGYREQPAYMKIVSNNVAVYDTMLVCSLPCSFGTDEGKYSLKVSAVGYRDTTVSVNAKYAVFKSGCPSSNSGGTRFSFKMQMR
jgi:hypothetical protein